MYADYTSAFISRNDRDTILSLMNEDLASIQHWLNANCLSINVSKSTFLHFRPKPNAQYIPTGALSVQGQPVSRSISARFLGVVLDDNLSGDAHIAHLRPKLAGAIGGICRASKVLDTDSCLLLYHAFFSSKLSYGLEYLS